MFLKMRIAIFELTFITFAACLPSSIRTNFRPMPGSLIGVSYARNTKNTAFDHIIVGGGNAGLTLAGRLSETPSTRVAVIEAGGFYEDSIGSGSQLAIPANCIDWDGKNLTDTSPNVDWGFATVPQAVIPVLRK